MAVNIYEEHRLRKPYLSPRLIVAMRKLALTWSDVVLVPEPREFVALRRDARLVLRYLDEYQEWQAARKKVREERRAALAEAGDDSDPDHLPF